MERLLTAEDLCEMWQVKKSWVYDEVQAGRLPHVKLGRALRFRQADLDEYVQAQHKGAA